MSNVARVASTAANVLTTPPNVEDVFSTFLYRGHTLGSAQTITNDINLSGEGGLVWMKNRDSADSHIVQDTDATGVGNALIVNSTSQMVAVSGTHLSAFNSNGFSIGTSTDVNRANNDFVSWTFRKAARFFDIVTYTGTGVNRTISHNLDTTPGWIIVKRLDSSGGDWVMYHSSLNDGVNPATKYIRFTTGAQTGNAGYWNNTEPTSTVFSVGTNAATNANGGSYVAYLFADNNNDGIFGPTGDQDIIKMGRYTGNGSTSGHYIDVGFEPQWLLIKKYDSAGNWSVWDSFRGVGTYSDHYLYPASSTSETDLTPNTINRLDFTATGFGLMDNDADTNTNLENYLYIAIRRGPMATPTSATDVFSIATAADLSNAPPTFISGFPVDFSMYKRKDANQDWNVFDRVRGDARELNTNSTGVETAQAGTYYNYDYMNGIGSNTTSTNANAHQFMWRRAPKFFDIVAWTGDGTTSRQISHDLGVQPQWMMLRPRDAASNWLLWFAALGEDHYFPLTDDTKQSSAVFINTADSTSFTLGTGTSMNVSGVDHIAWLFGSLDGVSKVGSYTGDGSYPRTIDCGFTSGARFIMIKNTTRTSGARSWYIWDTTRGIVAGNDPHLVLNSSVAEDGSFDDIDPHNSGFTIAQGGTQSNNNGDTFVFYAIA